MFNMTVLFNPAGCLTLTLEGSVGADALPEIVRLIEDGQQNQRRVVLDLGEVSLMDRVAVRFFAFQRRRGVELVNCPGYLNYWISRETIHEPQI